MAVYRRGTNWVVVVSYLGRRFYCYHPLPDGPKFPNRKAAADYEVVFSSVVKGRSGVGVFCETLFPLFVSWLSEREKETTVYGRKVLFDRYVSPNFVGVSTLKVDGPFLMLVNKRINDAPAGSVRNAVITFRLWVRFLRKWNPALDDSLCFVFRSSSPIERKYRVWTLSEEKLFLSFIEDPTDRLLFTILVFYGLRIGECLSLRYEDFSEGFFTVRRTVSCKSLSGRQSFYSPKTANSVRTLPVVAALASVLPKDRKKGYLFPSSEKGSSVLGETTVRRLNRDYARKAGLEPLKLHEFRHSCASNLLKAGISIRIVARWLGDTEVTVAATYSHLFKDEKEVIKDFFDGENG